MLFSASRVANGDSLRTDICVIGGGVAGLTLASRLQAAGPRITLLESGGIEEDPGKSELSRGEGIGRRYEQLTASRYRRLGGCSHLWNIDLGSGEAGSRLQALAPIDLEQRSWMPGSGWPFDFDTLDRHYREAFRFLRLGAYDGEAETHLNGGQDLLPLSGGRAETTLFRFMPRELFSKELPRELAASEKVQIVHDATVTELVTHPGSSDIDFVRVKATPGHEFEVRARTFVLAAGALENARLLLSSTSSHTDGLGNAHDLVGRYFMEHPHFCAGWVLPRDRSLPERVASYRIHRTGGRPVMAKLRISEAEQRSSRLMGYCVGLKPVWRAVPNEGTRRLIELRRSAGTREALRSLPADLVTVAGDMEGIVRYGRERVMERLFRRLRPNVIKLNAMTEQAPNPASRVTLSCERDTLGVRRVRLDWRLSTADLASVDRGVQILDEVFRLSGIGTVVPNPGAHQEIAGGWHHMGTTRMHSDPRRGVVDATGRLHGSNNLYLAGPSLFPTSGYANPTLTIVALTLRLAEHLADRTTEVRVPAREER